MHFISSYNALRDRLAPEHVRRWLAQKRALIALRSLLARLRWATPQGYPMPKAVSTLLKEIACYSHDEAQSLAALADLEERFHDDRCAGRLRRLLAAPAYAPAPPPQPLRPALEWLLLCWLARPAPYPRLTPEHQ